MGNKDSKDGEPAPKNGSSAGPEAKPQRRWVRPLLIYGLPWLIAAVVIGAVVVVKLNEGESDSASSQLAADGRPKGVLICEPVVVKKGGDVEYDPSVCPPQGAKKYQGLLNDLSSTSFTMILVDDDGKLGKDAELQVRKQDARYLDLKHWETHALGALPVNVYTKKYKGREVVVYMEDSSVKIDFDSIKGAPLTTGPG